MTTTTEASERWREPLVQKLIERHGGRSPEAILETHAARLRRDAEQDELPIAVDLIASVIGIRARRGNYDFAGRIYAEPSGQLVMDLNTEDSEARQRFTCAHELMHVAFPGFKRQSRYRIDTKTGETPRNKEEEYLCDFGAAALLMPSELVRGRYDVAEGLRAVERLAKDARVSLQAAGNRLVELAAEPVAFLVFDCSHKPADRPALRRGEEVPKRLRLRYAHLADIDGYLPRFKSADDDSVYRRAWGDGRIKRDREPLPGAPVLGEFAIEAKAYGYDDRRCVLAVARPVS